MQSSLLYFVTSRHTAVDWYQFVMFVSFVGDIVYSLGSEKYCAMLVMSVGKMFDDELSINGRRNIRPHVDCGKISFGRIMRILLLNVPGESSKKSKVIFGVAVCMYIATRYSVENSNSVLENLNCLPFWQVSRVSKLLHV